MTADRGLRFVRLAAVLRQQRESTARVVAEAREALAFLEIAADGSS
jgi:hypothetical protein